MDTAPKKRSNDSSPILVALTKTFSRLTTHQTHIEQFYGTIFGLHRRLRRSCSDYEIYPELTEDGILHYHAILFIKDEYSWFRYTQRALRRDGFIKCKGVRNLTGWRDYCSKKSKAYAIRLFELGTLYPITRSNIKLLRERLGSQEKTSMPQPISVPGNSNIVYKYDVTAL